MIYVVLVVFMCFNTICIVATLSVSLLDSRFTICTEELFLMYVSLHSHYLKNILFLNHHSHCINSLIENKKNQRLTTLHRGTSEAHVPTNLSFAFNGTAVHSSNDAFVSMVKSTSNHSIFKHCQWNSIK